MSHFFAKKCDTHECHTFSSSRGFRAPEFSIALPGTCDSMAAKFTECHSRWGIGMLRDRHQRWARAELHAPQLGLGITFLAGWVALLLPVAMFLISRLAEASLPEPGLSVPEARRIGGHTWALQRLGAQLSGRTRLLRALAPTAMPPACLGATTAHVKFHTLTVMLMLFPCHANGSGGVDGFHCYSGG